MNLPDWQRTGFDPEHPAVNGYTCPDPAAMSLALSCALAGFDLPEFDVWLSGLPEGDARNALLALRRKLKAALERPHQNVPPQVHRALLRIRQIRDVLAVGPIIERDGKRQAGTHKRRLPDIDVWMAKQLARDPNAKSPALWKSAPDWITEAVGYRAFAVRLTRVRRESAK